MPGPEDAVGQIDAASIRAGCTFQPVLVLCRGISQTSALHGPTRKGQRIQRPFALRGTSVQSRIYQNYHCMPLLCTLFPPSCPVAPCFPWKSTGHLSHVRGGPQHSSSKLTRRQGISTQGYHLYVGLLRSRHDESDPLQIYIQPRR